MYGASKFGRGAGGRGTGSKRHNSSFPLQPSNRPSGGSRLSLGGSVLAPNPRVRVSSVGSSASAPPVEESFSLIPGNEPLAYGMIIRLAPDLVDEIRRVEAQGGTARVKFGSMVNSSNGNVFEVGGKEFRFTWSWEFDGLCDIYEEHQSGEDRNGLLIEAGNAWRKLTVQRVLDDSIQNHVKMRSEEAERKHKSRKAIILDHGNPSMKSQLKQLAAAEANPWRSHFKQKKEPPFKKRKVEPPQVGGPSKSAYKSVMSSTTAAKGRLSSSPLPSPPEQSGSPASPSKTINNSNSHASAEDMTPPLVINKGKARAGSNKEIPTGTANTIQESVGNKGNIVAKPMDLQSLLVSMLRENPKGMSLKAIEKAIGDSSPNSVRKIEPIIKKIATFQAPGRYLLKPEVESETFKKHLSESGSSPEENPHQTTAPVDNHEIPASDLYSKEEVLSGEMNEHELNPEHVEESNTSEKINIQQPSPYLFCEKKGSDNNDGKAGSSSDSGSDSDSESDSSDSGSDSRSPSRSRSKSPVGSGSGSSSDSDSDPSSNSKEGSDEDVDIMTSEDDKEPKNQLQDSEPGFSASTIPLITSDDMPMLGGIDGKQDGHESDAVEVEKILLSDEQQGKVVVGSSSSPKKDGENPTEGTNVSSPDHDELQERQNFIGSLFEEEGNIIKDSARCEESDSSERISKGKYKMSTELKHQDERSEYSKKMKTGNSNQPSVSGGRDARFHESSHSLSSDRIIEDPYWAPINKTTNRADRDGNTEFASQKGYNQSFPGSSDFQLSSRSSIEQNAQAKPLDSLEKSENNAESLGRCHKYSEKSYDVHEGFPPQKAKFHRNAQQEGSHVSEKKIPKNSKEGGLRGKVVDSNYKKHGEDVGKLKESGWASSSFIGPSPKDNNRTGAHKSPVNGIISKLQREYSDLELGELREPMPEEKPVKKQFERKSSFKQSENKPDTADNLNWDATKGKYAGKGTSDLGKPCSPNRSSRFPSNMEFPSKKNYHDDRVSDVKQSLKRSVPSQCQYFSRVDNDESGPSVNKSAEMITNSRQNVVGVRQGIGMEGYGESNKKTSVSALEQHESKRGPVAHSVKGSKRHSSNTLTELADGRKGSLLVEGNNTDQKRRDSSSGENSCSYSKYEKEEPELKGPINDFSQYKDYVQEYRDKYDIYCSLGKILESYRNEFQNLGKDLDHAKGRDMEKYYNIVEQLKESYRQCGERHKRLKKIFVVLHEELKHLKQRIKDFASY